jgi:hypothetical protein
MKIEEEKRYQRCNQKMKIEEGQKRYKRCNQKM